MTTSPQPRARNPWLWVPSLYLAEGIPYAVVMTVSVIMYKRLGIPNDELAFYTSWLYLPWVIKPLWSPVVDILRTKRLWIIATQLLIGAGLAGIALTLPLAGFFKWSLVIFWLMAFSSATHDIAADGFYMLGLNEKQQAFFVGIRSTFYRIAMISAQGLLVILAGYFETTSMFGLNGSIPIAWSITFFILAGLFAVFFGYHRFILPYPSVDKPKVGVHELKVFFREFLHTFVTFFRKDHIGITLAFLLLYRLGEAQLVKLASPFLLDAREAGGLGLTTSDVGFVYGTVGIAGLTVGGILGGIAVARKGFRFWLWPMVLAIHLPDAAFVYLSQIQPTNFFLINAAVAIEQFGPLCDMHRVHGSRHDDPGHVQRRHPKMAWIPPVLHLGMYRHDSRIHHRLTGEG
ncbi:MAG: Beta-lactamase induction signal transducer [Bacteroidetes bacterium]|nr:Beta-lactamase induction signal transducer [Bacteroidota bacterium]